jgi:hypothetical protein
MPPKKSGRLNKLLKQTTAREKQQQQEKGKKRIYRPLDVVSIQRQIDEEQKVFSFVQRVHDMPLPQLLQATQEFINEPKTHRERQRRKNFFQGREGPLTLLSDSEFQNFLKNYLKETRGKVSLRQYWEDPKMTTIYAHDTAKTDQLSLDFIPYKNRPEIRDIIERKSQAQQTVSEQKALDEIDTALDQLSLEGKEIDETKPESAKGVKRVLENAEERLERAKKLLKVALEARQKQKELRKVQIVDEEKKSIEHPSSTLKTITKTAPKVCTSLMRRAPWVGRPNQGIFVYSLGEEPGYSYDKSSVIMPVDGQSYTLGRATNKFYDLLCSFSSVQNFQKGYVLHAFDNNNKAHQFYVAFKLGEKRFELQNEAIFAKQINWVQKSRQGYVQRKVQMLKRDVGEKIEKFGTTELENALRLVAPKNPVYSTTFSYAHEVIVQLKGRSKNAGDFLRRLAVLLVHLKDIRNTVFRERVKSARYTPAQLVSLTPQELYPDADLTNTRALVAMIKREMQLLANTFYSLSNLSERIPTNPLPPIVSQVPHMSHKDCRNLDALENIPEWKQIPYRASDGQLYCLDLDNVMITDLFGEDQKIPGTDLNIDESFVQDLRADYNDWTDLIRNGPKPTPTPTQETKEVEPEPIAQETKVDDSNKHTQGQALASDLINKLRDLILEKSTEANIQFTPPKLDLSHPNSDPGSHSSSHSSSNPGSESDSGSSDSESDSDSGSSDSDSDSGSNDSDSGSNDSDSDSGSNDSDSDSDSGSSDSDSGSSDSDSFSASSVAVKEGHCAGCGDLIGTNVIKTMVLLPDGGYKEVRLCAKSPCLENYKTPSIPKSKE